MKNKKSLFNESIDEAIVENNYGFGAGQQQTGSKPWLQKSPGWRGRTGDATGIDIQNIAAESEEFAKEAGNVKMFPLDQVAETLAEAYICLSNAEVQLQSCVDYNKVLTQEPEKMLVLDHCVKKVAAIKAMIKNVTVDFDRLTL